MRSLIAGAILVAVLHCHGCIMIADEESRPLTALGTVVVDKLRCEYRINPLGVDVAQPRLSWILKSDQRGQVQSAYQILVASSWVILSQDKGDLWNTGKVSSDQSIQIVYGGRPLTSQMRCCWKVRIWDRDDTPSGWSEPSFWTMGLLDPVEFKAKWIGFDESRRRGIGAEDISLTGSKWIWYPEGNASVAVPSGARYFRKLFTIPQDRKVKTAICAVTADDRFNMFLNGRRVRNADNFKRAIAADFAEHIRPGLNTIAIEAKNTGDSPNPAGLIVVLKIHFDSGEPLTIISDDTWNTAKEGTLDWMNPEFNDTAWTKAQVAGEYGAAPWNEVEIVSGGLFLPPAQYLRKSLVLTKPVRRATIHASALGNYELYVNGKQLEDAYFMPGWTDYSMRVYYNTFDVTDLLHEGTNALGAILADGWYSGYVGWENVRDHYGKNTRLAVQLCVEHTDGSSRIITTDDTWKAATGPILEGDFLMGETYDARKEMPMWCAAGFNDSEWQGVDVTEQFDIKVQSYPGVPVRKFKEIKPVSMTEPVKGKYVFDMGTNFAGFAQLKVSAEEGTKIVLRFAERLNSDGTIYTTNLRGARVTDTYICNGRDTEIWQPRFTFHGFQYIEVTGYPGKPKPDAITGIELTSATPVAGSFACSDETANKLYHNICQTQRANFIDIPTDCPQRDERLGWMGDAQIYVRTATYNTDVSAFFAKWLVDVEDAQLPNGAFSDVSPRKATFGGGVAAWGDAGVICPWTIYQVYADTRVLEEHYDAMTKWIEYCKGTTTNLLRPATGYGDWLSIKADTPKDVLATAYFAYSTKLVSQIARVLGKEDDALKYQQLYDDIKQAFNKAYVSQDVRIKGDTQTVYVLALAFDLLSRDDQPDAIRHLVEDIKSRDWHLSTGFVGTKDLMTTLSRVGQTDIAYRLFHNNTFPSWGFSIRHGATSIWERWDGWTPDKGFQDPNMNSFAHYSFGAVGEWIFKTIAGIDTDSAPARASRLGEGSSRSGIAETSGPAYKHIIIRPMPGGRLTWAKASYDSIHGLIETDWRLKGRTFTLNVTIPANTTATVYVPTAEDQSVKESGRPAAKSDSVKFLKTEAGCAVFSVGSGRYSFTSRLLP